MDKRKEKILDIIIKEHIKTGAPVGSGAIAEKYRLDISPATIRNEMALLEGEGLIVQPHTSAGRLPTEKAYNRFVAGIIAGDRTAADAGPAAEKEFARLLEDRSEAGIKTAAKRLASESALAVFWAFHRHNVYYTGLSNLFSQPEFSQVNVIYDISAVIDRIDEIINRVYDDCRLETEVLIGRKNPFGAMFGTIMSKYRAEGQDGLFGIIGPMRMDYESNFRLVETVRRLITLA